MTTIQDFKKGFHIGMHGLGMLHGIPHTNSLEAFKVWRKENIYFYEVDIAVTDDKQYILLAHNATAKDIRKLEVTETPPDGIYSLDWIRGIRTCKKSIKNGLQINTIQELLEVVANDDKIVVMIDPYGRSFNEIANIAEIIAEYGRKYPNLTDRVLLELYTLDDIAKIQEKNKDLHIIGCVREEGYDFWGKNKKFSIVQKIDFVSCKWKYIEEEKKLIDYCNRNNIGILSLTRFDIFLNKKKNIGINVNLVDVCGRGNILVYLKEILLFVLHLWLLLLQKIERKVGRK